MRTSVRRLSRIGVMSAIVIALIFFYLRLTSFGGRHRYDVILSLEWAGSGQSTDPLRPVFRRHAIRTQLASQHDLDENRLDLSYRLLLRDPKRVEEMLTELRSTTGVSRVTSMQAEDESEV